MTSMGITDTAKWRAVYKDGTMLNEVDPDGKEHLFKEIKYGELEVFELINQQNIPICQVRLGAEKRLIFARRNRKTSGRRMIMQGNVKIPVPVNSHQIVIILGWQKTINGINTKAIFYLMPDGRIEMDDQWREDSLHDVVNTPGLIREKSKLKSPNSNKPISENETKEKTYSKSNDSAFENKS